MKNEQLIYKEDLRIFRNNRRDLIIFFIITSIILGLSGKILIGYIENMSNFIFIILFIFFSSLIIEIIIIAKLLTAQRLIIWENAMKPPRRPYNLCLTRKPYIINFSDIEDVKQRIQKIGNIAYDVIFIKHKSGFSFDMILPSKVVERLIKKLDYILHEKGETGECSNSINERNTKP